MIIPERAVFAARGFIFADEGGEGQTRITSVWDTRGNKLDLLPLAEAKLAYAQEFEMLREGLAEQ